MNFRKILLRILKGKKNFEREKFDNSSINDYKSKIKLDKCVNGKQFIKID